MIPQNFIDWACSLSGCYGGNIEADTWICGSEWGAGSYGKDIYYETGLAEDIERGEVPLEQKEFNWKYCLYDNYGRNFAKIFAAMNGENVEDYRELALEKWNGSEIFAVNLYPIAFDSIDSGLWDDYKLTEKTGFSEKHLFQTWCYFNRFPVLAALRSKKKPKLIICTGINHMRDFFMCFDGTKNNVNKIRLGEISQRTEGNGHKTRRYYWVKIDKHTTLVVLPFLSGPHGLNSDCLLEQMGKRLTELKYNSENIDEDKNNYRRMKSTIKINDFATWSKFHV